MGGASCISAKKQCFDFLTKKMHAHRASVHAILQMKRKPKPFKQYHPCWCNAYATQEGTIRKILLSSKSHFEFCKCRVQGAPSRSKNQTKNLMCMCTNVRMRMMSYICVWQEKMKKINDIYFLLLQLNKTGFGDDFDAIFWVCRKQMCAQKGGNIFCTDTTCPTHLIN